jgi:hypothetical protein
MADVIDGNCTVLRIDPHGDWSSNVIIIITLFIVFVFISSMIIVHTPSACEDRGSFEVVRVDRRFSIRRLDGA